MKPTPAVRFSTPVATGTPMLPEIIQHHLVPRLASRLWLREIMALSQVSQDFLRGCRSWIELRKDGKKLASSEAPSLAVLQSRFVMGSPAEQTLFAYVVLRHVLNKPAASDYFRLQSLVADAENGEEAPAGLLAAMPPYTLLQCAALEESHFMSLMPGQLDDRREELVLATQVVLESLPEDCGEAGMRLMRTALRLPSGRSRIEVPVADNLHKLHDLQAQWTVMQDFVFRVRLPVFAPRLMPILLRLIQSNALDDAVFAKTLALSLYHLGGLDPSAASAWLHQLMSAKVVPRIACAQRPKDWRSPSEWIPSLVAAIHCHADTDEQRQRMLQEVGDAIAQGGWSYLNQEELDSLNGHLQADPVHGLFTWQTAQADNEAYCVLS